MNINRMQVIFLFYFLSKLLDIFSINGLNKDLLGMSYELSA